MVYCGKCGTKLKENANFCASCGNNVKKVNNIHRAKTITTKKQGPSLIVVFLFLISIYLILDFIAIQQLEFDTSLNSLVSSAENTKADVGLTSASFQTSLRLSNPTIIPVFLSAFSYDVSYGTKPVVEGRTGIVFIMPLSTSDVIADARVSYLSAGSTLLENVADLIGGEQKTYSANLYAEIGPFKVPVN